MILILKESWHGELCERRSYGSKGRWSQSKSQEDEYLCLHWISNVSSLKTPKDMFDTMKYSYEYELENSTQGCEDANVRKHSMLFHKEISKKLEAIGDNVKEVEA